MISLLTAHYSPERSTTAPRRISHQHTTTFPTTMSPPRPEINITLHLCSRTLANPQEDPVLQAANRTPFTLTHARTYTPIQFWADDLELDILIAFNLDPSRYKVYLHEAVPAYQPCPELEEVRALNYIDMSEKEHQVIDGTFEIHFVLREGVPTPTLAELQQWQERWKITAADPPDPRVYEVAVSPCNFRGATQTLDFASLAQPLKGDLETTLRHELGLLTTADLVDSNFAAAMGVNVEQYELSFHFSTESCEECRAVGELVGGGFEEGAGIRLHLEPRY